jgi:hypothetical protein
MITPEGQEIIDLVKQGDYWQSLRVSRNATPDEVSTAHLKLCHRFSEVVVALSEAKAALHTEPKARPSSRMRISLYWSRFLAILAAILASLPVLLLAMVGTALVLWNLHNIIFTSIVVVVFFSFILSLYKENYEKWYYIISVLIILWGGFSGSLFLVLSKVANFRLWASIPLALSAGLALFVYFGAPLLIMMRERLRRPSIWKCIGVSGVLFMLVFGLADLFFAKAPFAEIVSSALISIKSNTWLFYILWWVLAAILFSVFAGIYTGAVFSRSDWNWEWDKASEFRFCLGLMATLLSMKTVLEIIFYVPFIRDTISGIRDVVINVSEPILMHLKDFLLFQGAWCILTIPVYLLFIETAKGITRKAHWSLMARVLVGLLAFWVSMYILNWSVSKFGLNIPLESQFVIFQNAIFNTK